MKKLKFTAIFILIIFAAVFILLGHRTTYADTKTYTEHVVQPGETIWDIAADITPSGKDVRITIYEIRHKNDITPLIYPGQIILVPKGATE